MRARPAPLLWLLFSALSGADLFLTWRLLGQGRSSVYESNPLAAWFLTRFGWAGLGLFKVAAVAVVLTACAVLARRRPRMGTGVLSFGCLVLGSVVVYSSFLAGAAQALDDSTRTAEVIDHVLCRRLEQELDWVQHYGELQHDLAQDVIAGRRSLPDAVDRLVAETDGRDEGWVRRLRHTYRLESTRDCLAANLLRHLLRERQGDPRQWEERTNEWVATYRALYQVADPPPWVNPPAVRRS